MPHKYLLVTSRKSDGRMYPTTHKSEADALAHVIDLPTADWFIISIKDEGTHQRDERLVPFVKRCKFGWMK